VKDWQAPRGVYVSAGRPPVGPPEVLARLLEDMPNLRWLHGERVCVTSDSLHNYLPGIAIVTSAKRNHGL
jgi:hypothetical protein